jgi:hypothetical protein
MVLTLTKQTDVGHEAAAWNYEFLEPGVRERETSAERMAAALDAIASDDSANEPEDFTVDDGVDI